MRCYRFNHAENGGRVSRMVLSTLLRQLKVTSPLHPFIRNVCEYNQLATLNPNVYRSDIALYIIYHKKKLHPLTTRQLATSWTLNIPHMTLANFTFLCGPGTTRKIWFIAGWATQGSEKVHNSTFTECHASRPIFITTQVLMTIFFSNCLT